MNKYAWLVTLSAFPFACEAQQPFLHCEDMVVNPKPCSHSFDYNLYEKATIKVLDGQSNNQIQLFLRFQNNQGEFCSLNFNSKVNVSLGEYYFTFCIPLENGGWTQGVTQPYSLKNGVTYTISFDSRNRPIIK